MLGEILKNLRKSKKITQKQVADIINVSQQTYAKYENGMIEPNVENIFALSKYFNVSTDYLLGRDEKKEPPTEAEGIVQRLTKIIDNKYSKDELKSMTDEELNLISDIFIDTIKNVKKYNK